MNTAAKTGALQGLQGLQRRNFLQLAGAGVGVGVMAGPGEIAVAASARPAQKQARRNSALEAANKAVVGRWFDGFWGPAWRPSIIRELAAPDMLLQYSLHAPRRGQADILAFMTDFRAAFPDLAFGGTAPLIAQDDLVVGRWLGGGSHTGAAFSDFLAGPLPAATGRKMRFSGITVLRLADGRIDEEIGLDDGVTALGQLGLLKKT